MSSRKDKDQWEHITDRITISGDHLDERYAHHPFSDILTHYRIAHTGILTTKHPYELTRIHQNGSCIVATISGRGKVFVDGQWITVSAGQACLLPPFAYNSIRSEEGQEWTFAWVKYLEDESTKPVMTALSPVTGEYQSAPLKHAILGLYHNILTLQNKGAENLWVELIHKHVLLFSTPQVADERLWQLWSRVQQNLAHPWSIETLAAETNISTEHLRRLCQKQFGRSAKQQLLHLRMRKARILLTDKNNKIESVAQEVGYPNISAFSNAFKKFMGFSPSEMR